MFIEANKYLEHFGKKGMQWGVRKTKSNTSNNSYRNQKIKKVAIGAGIVGGAAFAGALLGRKGHISISSAQTLTNQKGAKVLRDVGRQFVKDSIDKKVLFNYARQINEGLVNL